MAERKDITGRDSYLLVQALSFTIEAFGGLPVELRSRITAYESFTGTNRSGNSSRIKKVVLCTLPDKGSTLPSGQRVLVFRQFVFPRGSYLGVVQGPDAVEQLGIVEDQIEGALAPEIRRRKVPASGYGRRSRRGSYCRSLC
jgi:hypothetical protein